MKFSLPRLTRDALMFAIGAIGFFHELFFFSGAERPTIIAASCALMGLPFVLRGDESRRKNGNGGS